MAERLVALGNVAPADQTLAIDLDKILVSLRNSDPAGLAVVIQAPWVEPVIASPQTDPYRLIGQARLAQLCGRLADTMARLAALRPVMPKTSDAYLRVEAILRDAGSSAAADAILAEAKAQFRKRYRCLDQDRQRHGSAGRLDGRRGALDRDGSERGPRKSRCRFIVDRSTR